MIPNRRFESKDKKDDNSLQNVGNVENCRIPLGYIAFIGIFLIFISNKSIHTCIKYLHFHFDYLSELSVNTTSGPSLLGEKETNFVREGLVVEFWREKLEAFDKVEVFRVDPVLL